MGPKYVWKYFLKFQILQKFLTSDRNFSHLSHLSDVNCFRIFQILIGCPLDPRNFWEAKLGKCGYFSPLCPKSNKKTTKIPNRDICICSNSFANAVQLWKLSLHGKKRIFDTKEVSVQLGILFFWKCFTVEGQKDGSLSWLIEN